MSNQDEFESLIKSFQLDDIEDAKTQTTVSERNPEPNPIATIPQKRSAPQPREQAQKDARNANDQIFRPQRRETQTSQPSVRQQMFNQNNSSNNGNSNGNKKKFKVDIDDEAFYEASSSQEKHFGRTGGGNGNGWNGGNGNDKHGSDFSRWMKAIIVLLIVVGVSIFFAIFALASASDLFGLNKPDKEITFKLDEGLSMTEVAGHLKKNGVITQQLTFQLYAGIKGNEDEFIPGDYQLNSNMSYDQILIKFRSGNKKIEEVKLIFYEGMTLSEIADKLEKNDVCTKEDLFTFLDAGEFPWELKFLEQVPSGDLRYRRFEGYLFPDTYIFNKGEKIDTVVQKFFVNFNTKINADLLKQIETKKMSIDQVITLASIIQKEAATKEDMAMISSVFHNRLANPEALPRLESDVTVFYVEDDIKPYLGGKSGEKIPNDPNQPIYDAYNTYACKGLPVGPICNPGLDAINAALNPTKSDYLFFIADKKGKCYYASTLAEHEKNIAEAELLGDAHGISTGIAEKKV